MEDFIRFGNQQQPISVVPQVDPLVSLMMVEKVPDSTYEMVGGLDKQIKEIKEVGKVNLYILLIGRLVDVGLYLHTIEINFVHS